MKIQDPKEPAATLNDAVIKLGLKSAPVVTKFAIGSLVVFVTAATVLSLFRSPRLLVPSVVAVLIVGTLAALLARGVQGPRGRTLGTLTAWIVVMLSMGFMGLFVSSAFFGVPEQGSLLVARLLGDASLVARGAPENTVRISSATAFSALPVAVLTDVPGATKVDVAKALSEQPALTIDGGTIATQSRTEGRVIAVHTLTLRNGGIVTNGGKLTIKVLDLIADNGFIYSFANAETGEGDGAGRSGGDVTIMVYRSIRGSLSINLSGEAGAMGANGHAGTQGAKGASGENAASGLFDCRHGPGGGLPGHPGTAGENGQAGADGGSGGRLIFITEELSAARNAVVFKATGGKGGRGGAGGPGGPGGPGGDGGSSNGICQGRGPAGESGAAGPPGANGAPGRNGTDGSIEFQTTF